VKPKRLVLVGGGHAHVLVLLHLRDFVSRHLEVVLVDPGPAHVYSGMVPGVIAGHYALHEAQIDLAALCREAGAQWLPRQVVSLDLPGRQMHLDDGNTVSYDIASLNIGAAPNHAPLAAKPFMPLLARWNELRGTRPEVAVVGAGAAGVELAMAMKFAGASQVALYSDRLAFAGKLRGRILAALERSGVELHIGEGPRPRMITVWTTGAAPAGWLRDSGLQTDDAGFVRVDATLRSVSHAAVFAAGDCASLAQHVPKSGVYAVRQGAVLVQNLKRTLLGQNLREFRPQSSSLMLISCGAKYAIASRGAWSAEGGWAWRWKDWIDRRWIERFR
jgi:selenide,water dikinase